MSNEEKHVHIEIKELMLCVDTVFCSNLVSCFGSRVQFFFFIFNLMFEFGVINNVIIMLLYYIVLYMLLYHILFILYYICYLYYIYYLYYICYCHALTRKSRHVATVACPWLGPDFSKSNKRPARHLASNPTNHVS